VLWEGGRRGGDVEDRRGLSGGAIAGGGIGTLALALIGYLFFGIDPTTTEQVVGQFGQSGQSEQHGTVGTPQDREGQFVDVITANLNDVWSARVKDFKEPRVVLYDRGTPTGCGFGQTAMGPFYCSNDATVYLDLSFWREMETQLGASGSDFAHAYVIAHEFGHHVQNLLGITQRVERNGGDNRYSVALELQADCFAGVWAAKAADASAGKVAPEPGDIEQGLLTAKAIGDDTLQRRATGQVVPERFTHGSSAQRVEWLKRGYQSGDPAKCDTFGGL
jgi:predicted metalloprotease